MWSIVKGIVYEGANEEFSVASAYIIGAAFCTGNWKGVVGVSKSSSSCMSVSFRYISELDFTKKRRGISFCCSEVSKHSSESFS